ncbi:MAG: DUF814 domain-containing protein [Desulfovibrio desulfuricans]|jgi:hypothetical protein|nr:DUF814 domain-containing protein [Desulfovibrio desulfuricans]
MDAHLFRRFCDALTPLLTGARVEKLQEPAPDTLVMTFYGAGRKRQLCLRFGRKDPFCFCTEQRVSVGRPPSSAVMRLRKYAAGRRVAACVVQWCARRLWLLLSGGPAGGPDAAASSPVGNRPGLTWLLLDLREGPSLHFLPEEESPEAEEPRWPEPSELAAALEHWRQWPVLTPALRRSLSRLDGPERLALLEDLRAGGGDMFCYGPARDRGVMPAVIRAASAWPLPPELRESLHAPEDGDVPVQECDSPDILASAERAGQDLVLARLAQEQARAAALPLNRRGRRLVRLLDKLREEERRLTAMRQGQADACALQENLWRWPPELRAASVHVEAGAHGPARDIALDARHTVREEMTRLFHAAQRGQRGLEHLAARRDALQAELAELRRALREGAGLALPGENPAEAKAAPVLPAGLPKNVQLFVSSDGFVLLRGRDARGNLAARKLAAGHDIWLHAENGPGAHVIIRRAHGAQQVPERTLDEAGALAAVKSWQKDAARARIQYAEVRHVKPLRNAPAGTVRIDRALPSREVVVDPTVEERLLPE